MLSLIRVKNYAIVDEVELEFGPGLSVVTGETGAGKSILIDAPGLARRDQRAVRVSAGASGARVAGRARPRRRGRLRPAAHHRQGGPIEGLHQQSARHAAGPAPARLDAGRHSRPARASVAAEGREPEG